MSRRAQVRSVEALVEFKAAMARFCQKAGDALLAIEMDAQRTLNWLTNDQVNYWRQELRRRQKYVSQARAELAQRRLAATSGRRLDLTEQQQALRAAELGVQEAERKIKLLRRWSREVEQASQEFQGQARRLADMVEGDPAPPVALLSRLIEALDAYLAVAPPPGAEPVPAEDAGAARSAAMPLEAGPDQAEQQPQPTPSLHGPAASEGQSTVTPDSDSPTQAGPEPAATAKTHETVVANQNPQVSDKKNQEGAGP